MKVSNSNVESFLANITSNVKTKCFLIYGPDRGLVRERVKKIIGNLVDDPNDPFRVIPLLSDFISKNPFHLSDTLRSESLLGGLKVVWIKEGSDAITDSVNYILNDSLDNIVVIEAGELGPRSKLRKECEAANTAASIACYLDDTAKLSFLAKRQLDESGLSITQNALVYLVSLLGSDRERSRNEIEKLALYKKEGEITTNDIAVIIDDSSAVSVDQSIFAIFSGEIEAGLKLMDQISHDVGSFITIIRSAQNHARRLLFIQSRVARGENIRKTIQYQY